MKNKLTAIAMALAAIFVSARLANAVTFTFQENGTNMDLGPTSTFTESGISLTASAFLTIGGATDLYAKNQGATETGLGTALDTIDHEILSNDFVQLTLPTTPPTTFSMVIAASVQAGETALVYFQPLGSPGTLTGATLIGTITTEGGSVTIPAGDQTGFIDITAGVGNILIQSVTVATVPDGGSALALLGIALAAIEGVRRNVRVRKA
jgi:hypothetical protein